MKFLIFLLAGFSLANAEPMKKDFPFLVPGSYQVKSGPSSICIPSDVRYDEKAKVLTIGAIYSLPTANKLATTADDSEPGCKLTEDFKRMQKSDHTVLDLTWTNACPKSKSITHNIVKIYKARITLEETIKGKTRTCIWTRG
jgi:hypothetical protein